MFDHREDQLTWEIIGDWPTEYTNANYHVRLRNSHRQLDASACKFLHHWYFLKESELLYLTKSGDYVEDTKFRYIEIFNLEEIGLHTKPLATERAPSMFNSILNGSAFRSEIKGEIFYRKDDHTDSGFLSFAVGAFTILYPPKQSAESAIEFCCSVKRAIFKTQA